MSDEDSVFKGEESVINEMESGPPQHIGRSLLVDTAPEHGGFGMYSYLLFRYLPTDSSRARYLAALEAYIELVDPIDRVLDYRTREETNITYLPVRSKPRVETPEALLKNYNYARSRVILDTLRTSDTSGAGPYIVSYREPLTNAVEPPEYLFQDLTPAPEHLVRLWVKEFLQQVKKPDYSRNRPWRQFALILRREISEAARFFELLPEEVISGLLERIVVVSPPTRN